MIRIFKHYIPKSILILAFVEIVILYLVMWAALTLRYIQVGFSVPTISGSLLEKSVFVMIVYLVMVATGLYRLDTCRELKITVVRLSVSMAIAFVAVSVALFTFPNIEIWRSVFFYAIIMTFVALMINRTLFQYFVDHESIEKRVIVLGAGERAKRVLDSNDNTTSNVNFISFLQMNEKEKTIEDSIDYKSIGCLQEYVEKETCQEIVVAIQERRGTLPVSDLLACKINGTYITDAASFIERQVGALNLKLFDPSWMIFSDGFDNKKKTDLFLKRFFDVIASTILLVVSMPILVITALAVKLTSQGPVFYRQERVGLMGQTFDVLKFRSMTVNAEADGVPKWADPNDVRVTMVGKFIRKTRIDEIPQIFNVLRGDMSFVGPRPERPFFVEQLTDKIPMFDKRHIVKPGITGWAQLNYPYGASEEDSQRKLEYDLYYIKNYSIFLDFLILVQTIRVVLWPDGVR